MPGYQIMPAHVMQVKLGWVSPPSGLRREMLGGAEDAEKWRISVGLVGLVSIQGGLNIVIGTLQG